MKIQLERTLTSCPAHLACVACQQFFPTGKLRHLLKSDRQLILGDLCPPCLKRGAIHIQLCLREQANRSMAPAFNGGSLTIASHRQALEQLEVAAEAVQFPKVYQRLLKKIEIFMEESQELETARFNGMEIQKIQRSQLEKIYKKEIL
jgi:hypothetical protein